MWTPLAIVMGATLPQVTYSSSLPTSHEDPGCGALRTAGVRRSAERAADGAVVVEDAHHAGGVASAARIVHAGRRAPDRVRIRAQRLRLPQAARRARVDDAVRSHGLLL